jgi:hypothetical protein
MAVFRVARRSQCSYFVHLKSMGRCAPWRHNANGFMQWFSPTLLRTISASVLVQSHRLMLEDGGGFPELI